jgi:hypothetical protein
LFSELNSNFSILGLFAMATNGLCVNIGRLLRFALDAVNDQTPEPGDARPFCVTSPLGPKGYGSSYISIDIIVSGAESPLLKLHLSAGHDGEQLIDFASMLPSFVTI